jgi:hypothetical protein
MISIKKGLDFILLLYALLFKLKGGHTNECTKPTG